MTKEKLLKRLEELEISYEKAIAQVNALNGAMMETNFWLKKLEEEIKSENPQKLKTL